jgi:aspartate aminotransferase
MLHLAERMSRARPSAILAVAEKAKQLSAQGRDVISFGIGVPNFLPGQHVYDAAAAALQADSGQYGSNRGPDALLDAFIEHMRHIGLTGYERRHCVTGDGAKHVLYNLFQALLDEGDGISFPVPYWTSYVDIAEIVGARVDLIPASVEQQYKITPPQLERALAKKPKVFLFNNPSNPTGMVYDESEVAALADVLMKYPDTWIIMDDIYNRMLFDGLTYTNLVLVKPELRDRAVFVDSISKTYGMPGWRLGLAAGPESIISAVVTLNANQITNVNEMVNAAGIAALTGPQDIPLQKCAEFASRRDQVMAVMDAVPGVVCPRPQGAFYVFPDISCAFGKTHQPSGRAIGNDREFCTALLDEKNVACVPGSAFGEARSMRISYTCPTPQLQPGLDRVKEFFSELI